MSTINEAREAVYKRWNDLWIATSFVFENETERDLPDGSLPWVRVTVRHTSSVQDTLGPPGARRFRRGASVLVQLYDLANSGMQTLDTLAQSARVIFEGASFSGLDFNNVMTRETGHDGKWSQVVVEAFFDYEEIR